MGMQYVLDGTDLGLQVVRLGSLEGLISEAEEGTTGQSTIAFDDVAGSLTVSGWRPFYVNEQAGPAGQQRLFTGFVGIRRYGRAEGTSLITGASRRIECDLVDINAILSFRLFPPTDTNANRGSETDVARLQWLLSTTYLSPTVHDYGFVNTSGGVTLDAADYRGQSPMSLVSDCANASGKNYYLYWDESHGGVGQWYDFDYSTNFTCTLTLSNVLSDVDNSTCFAFNEDAELTRDPSRVYSGVQVPFSGTGSPVYVQDSTTIAAFVSRDITAPNANAKTSTQATAQANTYLTAAETEADSLTLTVRLPAAKTPLVRAGMRIQVKASHLPDLTSFTYVRIMHAEYKQVEQTPDSYDVLLTMIPPGASTPKKSFTAPSWNFGNVHLANRPGLTMNNPGDPSKHYTATIRVGGSSGTLIGTYPNTTTSADSTAGDGTGIDNFSDGPSTVFSNLTTYEIWCTVTSSAGNVGYSNGTTYLTSGSGIPFPVGTVVTQIPTGAVGPIAIGTPFLLGKFTITLP